MKRILALLALSVPLLWGCNSESTSLSGTNDETTTSLAVIYRVDGQPAVGARVLLYASGDTQSTPRAVGIVDDGGHVSLTQRLPAGSWSLLVRGADGTALFQDSLPSDGTKLTILTDTLRRTGTVKGRVRVQPQDKPTIAWVQLIGAGRYANVDDSGRFAFDSVPSGRLTLAALTLQPQYTPTFRAAPLRPDSILDLGTIDLIYTGVPMVTGVKAVWDSLAGTVTVTWDSVPSTDILGYRVFRSSASDPFGATEMAYVTAGGNWIDTALFSSQLIRVGRYDSAQVENHYRVAAVTSKGDGPRGYSASVTVRSAVLVGSLAPTWSLIGSLPASNNLLGLDSLGSGLACMTGSIENEPTLWTSTNGATWSISHALDRMTLSWTFWKGSLYWVTGHPSGKTTNINIHQVYRPGSDTILPTFDSLKVHRFDGSSTTVQSFPSLDSLIVHARFLPMNDRLMLLDARQVITGLNYTASNFYHTAKLRITQDGRSWSMTTSDSAPSNALQRQETPTGWGDRYGIFFLASQTIWYTYGDIFNRDSCALWTTPGTILPIDQRNPGTPLHWVPSIDQLTSSGSRLFVVSKGKLRWAPLFQPRDWHQVLSPSASIQDILAWRNQLLVSDGTTLWSTPLPSGV